VLERTYRPVVLVRLAQLVDRQGARDAGNGDVRRDRALFAVARVATAPRIRRRARRADAASIDTARCAQYVSSGFHYSLAKLPDEPMRPRVADERVGFFWTDRLDYSSDTPRVPIVRYVNRWRLEKKDPSAAMSEPKQPIVYWIERNVP
jgi:hypothetical protein